MDNWPVMEFGERYGEKKLGELLEYATNLLVPGPGYSLELDGMNANTLMHNELEAYFGHSIDTDLGMKVTLGYDEMSEGLVLKTLDAPIKGTSGHAYLFKTETLGYQPSLEFHGKLYTARKEFIDPAIVDRILPSLGIDAAPTKNQKDYQSWRESLLQKTSGWHLLERREIPEAASEQAVQFSTLQREETLDLKNLNASSIRSFTRTIVQFEGDERHHTEQVLEMNEDMAGKHLHQYLKSYSVTADSPFVDFEDVIKDQPLTNIVLTEGSFKDAVRALSETIHSMHQD